MIKGVCFCHRNNTVHRDIKPENLLINPYSTITSFLSIDQITPLKYAISVSQDNFLQTIKVLNMMGVK
jgi:serine/threonine protein kinase